MKKIFADYNSTTPLCMDVIKQFNMFNDTFGNMESSHQFGQKSHALYYKSTDSIKKNLGANSYKLYACSSATEANHWFFSSILSHQNHCPHVITSSIEHPCVLEPLKKFAKENTIKLSICPVDNFGIIDLNAFKHLLTNDTYLVSIMLANNELGTIQPLKEITTLSKQVGATVHSDIVQAVGKLPLNLNDIGLDAITISGHKCYAPTGCGALLLKDDSQLIPIFLGGAQQNNRRAGTVNVMGIHLFSIGLDYCLKKLEQHVDVIKWIKKLKKSCPKIVILSSPENPNVLWNTVCIGIPGMLSHDFMMALDLAGIAVATGSACTTGAIDISPVILSLGVPEKTAKTIIRLSFGYPTTTKELDTILLSIQDIYKLTIKNA